MHLWIQEEARIKSSRTVFPKIHANKLGILCAILCCYKTDAKKSSIHLKVFLTAVGFFLMKQNDRNRSLSVFPVVSLMRNIGRKFYNETP